MKFGIPPARAHPDLWLRHPFVSARGAATLDIVSEGRFDFGVGARWLREGWHAVGRAREALEGTARFAGEYIEKSVAAG